MALPIPLVKASGVSEIEMAREKHIKILPLCPFAKRVFDKTEEYKDVLF
jgi:predicted GNAT family acetyltransferase